MTATTPEQAEERTVIRRPGLYDLPEHIYHADPRRAGAGVPGPLPLRTSPPAGAAAALRLRHRRAQTRARRRPRTRRARLPGLAHQGRPRSSARGPRTRRDPAQTRRLRADPG